MRFRYDALLISSVLFTVSLLLVLPYCWTYVENVGSFGEMDAWRTEAHSMWRLFGHASLAIISIALIVTWMGYFKRVRWTWFVLFIIACWAYEFLDMPVLAWNLFRHGGLHWMAELVHRSIYGEDSHLARVLLESMAIFAMMLVALALPITSLLLHKGIRSHT